MSIKALTESTGVSIALVITLCVGAYWSGVSITELKVKTDSHSESLTELRKLTKEVAEVAKANKMRLDIMMELKR